MRVIIAGSRTINDLSLVKLAILHAGFDITEVVCGEARGVDSLGKMWAKAHNVPVKSFPADWDKYGKTAGYIRNSQMTDYGEALIAITTVSPGTKNMIALAKAKGILTHIEYVKENK